ncbi:unnamed protein product [Mytilus coruscus]|uniref:Uncharacterized protein n=1 Tax=Mytilus coruscus TaxID=42192 RepID=A0A6J8DKC2_MYTCO|nr:unnamed protein product [Mytilus coruscus]
MAELLSSEMNMCQSLVKPDCSKPKVMKSKGIQEALISMLADLKSEKKDLITLDTNTLPNTISTSIQMATVEFTGVKFKTKVSTGIHTKLAKSGKSCFMRRKYSFTPDHFKAAAHQQRKAKEKLTISHLKDPDARKDDIITTREKGKILIRKFLAANAVDLRIYANVILDIDSELNLQRIQCQHGEDCTCEYYTTPTPIRCIFLKITATTNCSGSLSLKKGPDRLAS